MNTQPSKIWTYDSGKASLGVGIRTTGAARFDDKQSLLIPADLGRRGPSTKTDTPAARFRAWVTRKHRKTKETWLDELWTPPELTPLQKRKFSKTSLGWQVAVHADPFLEGESAADGGKECATSCLLRIALHNGGILPNGEGMSDRQIYKALHAANQKRGTGAVPWERGKNRANKDEAAAKKEAAENAAANAKWNEFTSAVAHAGPGKNFHLPCYYDAWRMKLWNPVKPDEVLIAPLKRPESTRKVSFPVERVEAEIMEIARSAASIRSVLDSKASAWMTHYKAEVLARIEKINAYRRERGRSLKKIPPFKGGASDFATLFTYGPGGPPNFDKGTRALAPYDPALRRDMGLRPGHPDNLNAAVGQIIPRFDNRLRQECALLGPCGDLKKGFNTCRNTTEEDLKRARSDSSDHEDDAALLPAQVTFLMKLKNLWVAEKSGKYSQRKLLSKEINEVFTARSKTHEYWVRPGIWRREFCASWGVEPLNSGGNKKSEDKEKETDEEAKPSAKNTDFIVEPPNTSGRSRFSRPALRLLKELILSGLKPSEFKKRLLDRDEELLTKAGVEILSADEFAGRKSERTHENGRKYKVFIKQEGPARSYVLEGQLDIFGRMRPEDPKEEESWENLFIPSRRADFELRGDESTPELRKLAIQKVIGSQNNPIVRHRLQTYWDQLCAAEKIHGEPEYIALELVRDDLENSWLGGKAKEKISKSRDENEAARNNAREKLKEAKLAVTERNILRYLLWEAQGGECLYGKEVKAAGCVYLETGLPITDLESYRIDHIVPRAMGGPDSFSNYVLTTDDTNARKGDRTPWQWFRDNGFQGWESYCERLKFKEKKLGFRKARLLASSEAEKLVSRYTPLAETAWIARTSAVIANLHFGWTNGVDGNGKQRVFTFAGGLTARVRRQYMLDSLLGADRSLDEKITDALSKMKVLEAGELSDVEREERLTPLREQLEKARKASTKDRSDPRHHALDAMVLSFLVEHPEVRDNKRADEFRFEALGDTPCFRKEDAGLVAKIRDEISALGKQYKELGKRASVGNEELIREGLSRDMEQIQIEITRRRDRIGKLWQKRNWHIVREAFRRELHGDAATGTKPVLPRWLHYPKPRLESYFHRGIWMWVEDEKKAENATIENYDEAFIIALKPVPLPDFPFVTGRNGGRCFDLALAARLANAIAPHKDYSDLKSARKSIMDFIATKPSEAEWLVWSSSEVAPAGIKPKKGEAVISRFKVVKMEEKRTRRQSVYGLGVGSDEVAAWDASQFELQVSRLIKRPQRAKKGSVSTEIILEADTELQSTLRSLRERLESFFVTNPPDHGKQPRQPSARVKFEEKKEKWKQAWIAFQKTHGLDKHTKVCLRTDPDKVSEKPYEEPYLLSVVLSRAKRFDEATALNQFKAVTDPWTRFLLRQFVRLSPSQREWTDFCKCFVQVLRDDLRKFLSKGDTTAEAMVKFYQNQYANAPHRSPIEFVQQVIGGPDEYVDVSKDGSGIYAKGGNRCYLMYKQVSIDESGEKKVRFGTRAVRGFEKLTDVRKRLLLKTGMELYDEEPWRTNMLLHLPKSAKSGENTTPAGFYYFGSVSNEASMTLKPLAGGDTLPGRMVSALLEHGLQRHIFDQ